MAQENGGKRYTRRELACYGAGLAGSLLVGCGAEPLVSATSPDGAATPTTDQTAGSVTEPDTASDGIASLYRRIDVDVAALEADAIQFVPDDRVIIGRDSAGIYAMTSICPHAGCDMRRKGEITGVGLACNCHGSLFDRNGRVLRGPAERDLVHYMVYPVDRDTVTVEVNHNVPDSTRLEG